MSAEKIKKIKVYLQNLKDRQTSPMSKARAADFLKREIAKTEKQLEKLLTSTTVVK
jgi:hypothetical protein